MKYVTLAEQTVAYMKEQYVDRELLLKDQLLEMPQEPAKETKYLQNKSNQLLLLLFNTLLSLLKKY